MEGFSCPKPVTNIAQYKSTRIVCFSPESSLVINWTFITYCVSHARFRDTIGHILNLRTNETIDLEPNPPFKVYTFCGRFIAPDDGSIQVECSGETTRVEMPFYDIDLYAGGDLFRVH